MISRSNPRILAVRRIAEAIATAEGYYLPSSLPARLNNPGSLKGSDGVLLRFETADEGWQALYRQVELMITGKSAYYRPTMTIQEIAQIYTGGDKPEPWARIVAAKLGTTPDRPIGEVLYA